MTGGAATSGVFVGSTAVSFVVSPVVIDDVTGEVKVPGSDTIVPLSGSVTAMPNAPIATSALPPTTADKVLMLVISTLPIDSDQFFGTGSPAKSLTVG
ncbi:hypothetical protein CRM90_18525 [Mycobacterium sp. ENV421]|nr:hypothetical protein CRM90_18525 [Mycobacterium sp. ENV421]